MWKNIRVAILLVVLLVVAVNAYRDQNQDWNQPIHILLHPINADGLATTQQYIQQLQQDDFAEVKQYLEKNSQQYRGQSSYFMIQIGRELQQVPPKMSEQPSILNNILWSLKFRFYAWEQHQSGDGSPSLTLYLNYYDPKQSRELKHSTALERGRIGSVNLFASPKQAAQNNVVLVHELLHGFGATDKYNLNNGEPIFPIGYAQADQQPLYPQTEAEIMGGRIPLSEHKSKMPNDLNETVISILTAREVGWIK
ncbi:hypothetical protein [Acinetobacter courvalinii]|uniref:Uncharacterized protein n=1 Tax=Acinetobacter courvalinii TaxID=280147 RepID=N9RDZ4_9GAMM|nr:hypothetical protein [Acinetobacter courvalinii]ENX40576.1 hypothetical protein F888_00046 [Acinetobacter courvalinii]KAB0661757.1 hypothetical protein F7P77_00205 [Acinetobacter courvalinii]RSN80802.1 hypothetical protein EA770_14365 [Acinetobacter baumannii]GGH43123.1 hypothetical protein GCM10007354_31370 [Acinetobacter courvalinii]